MYWIYFYLRFTIWDLRFKIWDLRFTIWDLRFGIYDLGFTIWDLGFDFFSIKLTQNGYETHDGYGAHRHNNRGKQRRKFTS